MADTKISDLNELTSGVSDDVLPIVDTSTIETKKITLANLSASMASAADQVLIVVKNSSGVQIDKMKVVYINGATGALPTILLADNTDHDKAAPLGLVIDDIANGAEGSVIVSGTIDSLDTTAWNDGDSLYFTTAGGMSSTVPTSGEVHQIGTVSYDNASNGKIVMSHHNEPYLAVAAGEDLDLRMGDDAGATAVIFENYSDAHVAQIDSLGNISGADLLISGNINDGTNSMTVVTISGAIVHSNGDGSDHADVATNTATIEVVSGAVVLNAATIDTVSGAVVTNAATIDTVSGALVTHEADSSDPHGVTLTQTNLTGTVISGGSIISTTDAVTSGASLIRNMLIGTEETPPAAASVTQGTLYVQYTA